MCVQLQLFRAVGSDLKGVIDFLSTETLQGLSLEHDHDLEHDRSMLLGVMRENQGEHDVER